MTNNGKVKYNIKDVREGPEEKEERLIKENEELIKKISKIQLALGVDKHSTFEYNYEGTGTPMYWRLWAKEPLDVVWEGSSEELNIKLKKKIFIIQSTSVFQTQLNMKDLKKGLKEVVSEYLGIDTEYVDYPIGYELDKPLRKKFIEAMIDKYNIFKYQVSVKDLTDYYTRYGLEEKVYLNSTDNFNLIEEKVAEYFRQFNLNDRIKTALDKITSYLRSSDISKLSVRTQEKYPKSRYLTKLGKSFKLDYLEYSTIMEINWLFREIIGYEILIWHNLSDVKKSADWVVLDTLIPTDKGIEKEKRYMEIEGYENFEEGRIPLFKIKAFGKERESFEIAIIDPKNKEGLELLRKFYELIKKNYKGSTFYQITL
jgi:hypothetical protein